MSSHALGSRHVPGQRRRTRRPRKRATPASRLAKGSLRGGAAAGSINWDRFGRVVLVVVLFAVLASYLNPVIGFVHAWQDSKTSKERLLELQQESAALHRQAAAESTDAVIIREARRLGMVRTGERAFVVHGLPD
ncbi:MAG: hypothetical protein ABR536_02830 [Solirubrobacterales bacterium]